MGSIARSGTWDEASSPAATRLARRFEDAWRDPRRKRNDRPDPRDFLPGGAEGSATPAAWLALLRAELNLRWDDGESLRVEEYRDRYPGLGAETMVALCYEEFCRRDEDGQAPFPAEYDERFPDLSDRLRRVFDIHDILGNAASTDLHVPGPELTPFPEARQTIAGFHLVEELGRGSFARVFLAQERQLADRPVALKVARTGSREPQTLARLQHTHIVPVHSYRTDLATGLHLLCMPYFGRVTLSRLLDDPAAKVARSGEDLLDALDRLDSGSTAADGSRSRSNFARLPFTQAIAWWGARLAEALAHAHDRGVLHRDIKPSNVLVTGDGLPMLLDFNLAGEPWANRQDYEPENLGGTLAYMAPEHLEAVSKGEDDRLDARADIFSMGVLLFEALTGSRPFPSPKGSSVPEALQRAADDRRREPPWICRDHPEVPASMERVIRRCLEPDPAARFPNASELADDLQAVADDSPLKWTREPLVVRGVRWVRRSWKKGVLVALLTGSAVALAMSALQFDEDRARVASTASDLLKDGRQAFRNDDFATALARFDEVARLTSNQPELIGLNRHARVSRAQARLTEQFRAKADAFSKASSTTRFRLIGVDRRPEEAKVEVERLLAPFRVLTESDWARQPELNFLDAARRARLIREVEEVLFFFAAGLDPRNPQESHRGMDLCDRALVFADDPKPWQALRNWLIEGPVESIEPDPHTERSAKSCFEWGVLLDKQRRKVLSIRWFERAITLEPNNSWYHYQLATLLARGGDAAGSLAHYQTALALEPSNYRFLLDRAKAHRLIGDWARAEEDEERARSLTTRPTASDR